MAALLERAIEFAVKKHAGQVRKGTTIPYVTHVIEAMEIVSRMTEDEEIRAAAVLHDTLEDTETTKEELLEAFSERITVGYGLGYEIITYIKQLGTQFRPALAAVSPTQTVTAC